MVSIEPIKNSAKATDYFQKEDYYTRDKSGHGAWVGNGVGQLGLRDVTPEAFQSILEGRDPDGNTLVPPASNGIHRPGWDFTFSPDKSVSLVWAFGNEEQRAAVIRAHNAAKDYTMNYFERNLIQARVTVNGSTSRINTGNIVAARFDHFSSRELDPDLHTHVVVANMTMCPDGKFRAIANEKALSRELAIALYHNQVAYELKGEGFPVYMKKHESGNSWYACIAGAPEPMVSLFSKRSHQIDESVERFERKYLNASRGKLRHITSLGTRRSKLSVHEEALKEYWSDQLKESGFTAKDLSDAIEQARTKMQTREIKYDAKNIVEAACNALNEQQSTFSREAALMTSARISAGNCPSRALESAFYELEGSTIICLDKEAGIYTTERMKGIEEGILRDVRAGSASFPPLFSEQQVQKVVSERYGHLTEGQKKALEHVLTARDRVIGIQGDAGTGKTTMLRAAREQLEGQGYRVRGLSFTGKAAQELQNGAGIRSSTLHSFLPGINTPEIALTPKEAWFVDEASMVGSHKMSEIISAAQKANARLVLVGDTKQLQSISAGNIFKNLQESGIMKTVEMKEVVRQQTDEYKEIVSKIAEKETEKAFDLLARKNKIKEIADPAERHEAIVARVISQADHKDTLVVTAMNRDRRELNARIREALRQKGKLSGPEYEFTVRETRSISPANKLFADSYQQGDIVRATASIKGLRNGAEGVVFDVNARDQTITVRTAAGNTIPVNVRENGKNLAVFEEKLSRFTEKDKVVFLKNDKSLGVQNGLTGQITRLDEQGNITVRIDSGRNVTWNVRRHYNYIDHGYAVTTYKSQGQTSKEVILNADVNKKTSYQEFYTAVTRGKLDLAIYTNGTETLKEQAKTEARNITTIDFKTQIEAEVSLVAKSVYEKDLRLGRDGI